MKQAVSSFHDWLQRIVIVPPLLGLAAAAAFHAADLPAGVKPALALATLPVLVKLADDIVARPLRHRTRWHGPPLIEVKASHLQHRQIAGQPPSEASP